MHDRNQSSRRVRPAAFAVICLLATGTANAQENPQGFYVGVNAGVATSAALNSTVSAVTHPTKCDRLLYADPAMAPSGAPECMDTTPRELSSNAFSPGPGFTGGVSAGYAISPLRVEFEYRTRSHGEYVAPLISSSANPAGVSKTGEWSSVLPPTETVSGYRSNQFFANLHVDFANDSRWTPSLGAGVGMARTHLIYSRRVVRKTLAEGYQDVEPPLTVADRPAAAAGTLSLLEPTLTGSLVGYQLLGGVDYAIGERTTIGVSAHWARFGELAQDDVWSIIRSHEPVRADGVTPFSTNVAFDSLQYWAVTFGMKYYF